MSRAFVKEKDGDAPDDGLPRRAASAEPNYVTPAGLTELRAQLDAALAEQHRVDVEKSHSTSKRSLASLARDIRYLRQRIDAAILVEPASAEEIRIGATVVIDDGTRTSTYTIVGEDQADPARGLVSWTSPLGRVLIGARRGDKVVWPRPAGDLEVTVIDITA